MAKSYVQRLMEAKREAVKIKELVGDLGGASFQFEINGPSEGIHSWAVPNPQGLPIVKGSIHKDIMEQMGKHPISKKVSSKDEEYLLHAVSYCGQGFANDEIKRCGNELFALMGSLLYNSMIKFNPLAVRIEVKLTSVPSPFAQFGMSGADKFLVGYSPDSYVRLFDKDGQEVYSFTAAKVMA